MEVDENLRKKFDDEYLRLYQLQHGLYGRSGSIGMTILVGFVCLPFSLVIDKVPAYVSILFWLSLLFFIYRSNKYLPEKDQLLKNISDQENTLFDNSGLRYCGCDIGSHFFSPDAEKLYNVKYDILFDQHQNDKYIKWHKRYCYKQDPNWLLSSYYHFSLFIVFLNVMIFGFHIITGFEIIT